jgi:hypothetical protein
LNIYRAAMHGTRKARGAPIGMEFIAGGRWMGPGGPGGGWGQRGG